MLHYSPRAWQPQEERLGGERGAGRGGEGKEEFYTATEYAKEPRYNEVPRDRENRYNGSSLYREFVISSVYRGSVPYILL